MQNKKKMMILLGSLPLFCGILIKNNKVNKKYSAYIIQYPVWKFNGEREKSPGKMFCKQYRGINFIQFAALIAAYMQGNFTFHLFCNTTIVSTWQKATYCLILPLSDRCATTICLICKTQDKKNRRLQTHFCNRLSALMSFIRSPVLLFLRLPVAPIELQEFLFCPQFKPFTHSLSEWLP